MPPWWGPERPLASSPSAQPGPFPDDLSPVVTLPLADRSLPSTATFSTTPSQQHEPLRVFRPIHAPAAPRRRPPERPLATSSPPDASYTRERLLGAVQRVRCSGRALRHSAPELGPEASVSSASSGRGSSAARGDSLQGERPPRLDQSVDENYEFAPALSPGEEEDTAEHGLSDSELYGSWHAAWDSAEARCAALKREFLLRRRRRPLESAC